MDGGIEKADPLASSKGSASVGGAIHGVGIPSGGSWDQAEARLPPEPSPPPVHPHCPPIPNPPSRSWAPGIPGLGSGLWRTHPQPSLPPSPGPIGLSLLQCLCFLNSTKNVMGWFLSLLPNSLINSTGQATPGEVFWSKEPHKSPRCHSSVGNILCKKVFPGSATGRRILLQAAPLIIKSQADPLLRFFILSPKTDYLHQSFLFPHPPPKKRKKEKKPPQGIK